MREDQDQQAVRAVVMEHQMLSRTSARQFRLLLYAASLLMIGGLVHLGLRLRSRALALQRRAAFEHVIAGVSMRFINARPQRSGCRDRAGARRDGGMLGADRVYFLLARPSPRVHSWHRAGVLRQPGWPEGALALPALFGPTPDGIVHVPRVKSRRRGSQGRVYRPWSARLGLRHEHERRGRQRHARLRCAASR